MSDPVTNVEIEDVLASIRRLVTEGDRTRPTPNRLSERPARPAQENGASADSSRFVLTPALRVSTPKDEPVVTTNELAFRNHDSFRKRLSGVHDDRAPEAGEDAQAEEALADGALADDALVPEATVENEAANADASAPADVADELNASEDEALPVDDLPEEVAEAGAANTPDVVEDDVAEISPQDDEPDEAPMVLDAKPEPTASEVQQFMSRFAGFDPFSMVSDGPGETAQGAANAAQTASTETDANDADEQQTPDFGAEMHAEVEFTSGRVSLEAKIAALEAAVSGQTDEWEPDGSEVEQSQMEWTPTDTAGSRSRRTSEPEDAEIIEDTPAEAPFVDSDIDETDVDIAAAEEAAGDDEIEGYLDEIGEIDEESLRQLVADVVREELSGELGERITRNIRKLVRREISRALSISDLE